MRSLMALERWPRDGVPDNPAAWITTTARNRAIDRLRRAQRLGEKTGILAGLEALRPPPGAGETARRRRERSPTTGCG